MDPQLALAIGLIALGGVVVVVGLLLRPIWRTAIRPLYRQPDAQEPSELGWRLRTAILLLGGVGAMVGGALLASSIAQQSAVVDSEAASVVARCGAVVDAVDRPTSLAEADAAIMDAAASAGLDVDRADSETEDTAPLPSGETVVVVEQTRWTVRDGSTEVASFTWTSSEGIAGRFSAEPCD